MKEHIIQEIRRIAAANGGQAPGKSAFQSLTGIGESKWSGVYWSKWGDALVEAGFAPNEWGKRYDTSELTKKFAELTLAMGHIPTVRELKLMRRTDMSIPSPGIIAEHFGGVEGIADALRTLALDNVEYGKLSEILPTPKLASRAAVNSTVDGSVYLIKSGDFYKIGRSDELERRVKEIRIALPEKSVLFHTIATDDPPGIEAYWHRRFADKRANGEWFKLTLADVAAFKRRKFQ